jgi:hypothetical protein
MNNAAPLIWIALLLPAAIFLALPRLTYRGYFFGITVAPDFPQTESGHEIRRGYTLTVAVAFVLGLALGIIVPQAMPAALFLPIFASTGAFFYARHHVKPFSTSAHRPPAAEVGGGRESLPAWTLLGLPPFAVPAIVAAYLRSHCWSQTEAHECSGPLAKRDGRTLGGKLPPRDARPRHRSERTASEAAHSRLRELPS